MLSNGDLVSAADDSHFDVFVTTDKNLRYRQNLNERKVAIVVLGNSAWPIVRRHVNRIVRAIESAKPGTYVDVAIPDS